MPDEHIGLEGVLDLGKWDSNVSKYLADNNRMNDATSKVAGAIGKSFADLGESITVAMAATAAAIGGVIALGAKEFVGWTVEGIQGAIDLEQRVADIGSVLGATAEESQKLGGLIDDLALDPKLVVGTDEAADAIENLARNGLAMDDILNGAARSVVLLANATGGSFATSADVATDMLGQFNLAVSDLPKAVDIAQGVINNSKFTIDDWSLALAQGGGAAGALGVELEDFAAAIAGTSHLFGSGSDAGTSFKTMLQRLVPQSKEAAKEMRNLGLYSGLTGDEFDKMQEKSEKINEKIAKLDPTSKNYAERLSELQNELNAVNASLTKGQSAFFDSEGNMRSMTDIAGALQNALGSLSEEQRTEALTTIFGSDSMRAAIGLMDLGAEGMADMREQVVKLGSAQAAAATRTDTLKAKMQILGDAWEAIQRKSGGKFEELLKRIVEQLIEFTSANGDRIVAFFEAFAELMGTVWDKMQPLITQGLPKLIDNINALARWLVELGKSGNTSSEWLEQMSPGLRTLVERTLAVVEALKTFRGQVEAVFGRVQEFIQPLTDWIAAHVKLEDVLVAAGLAVAAFLAPLALAIAQMAAVGVAAVAAVAFIREAWETNLGGVRDFVAGVWEKIQGIVATGSAIVAQLFGEGGENMNRAASAVWDGIQAVINGALDAIQWTLTTILLAMEGDWGAVWQRVLDVVTPIWESLKTAWSATLTAITQYVTDHWPEWVAKLGEWATAAWQWIVDVTPKVLTKLGEWGAALWGWVTDNAPEWGKKLGAWAAQTWTWLTETVIPAVATKLGEWWTALSAWVTENAPKWATKLGEWGAVAWEWLTGPGGVVSQVATKLGEWWTAIKSWIDETLPKLEKQLEPWTTALVEWVKNATPKTTKALGEWHTSISEWFATALADFLVNLVKWTTALVEWIGNAVPGAITAIGDFVTSLVAWMTGTGPQEGVGKLDTGLESWTTRFVNWVGELITRLVPEWAKLGTAMVTALTNIGTAIDTAKAAIVTSFFNAGVAIGQGLIDGVNSMIGAAQAKIAELATLAAQAAAAALGIQSPSKVFWRIGEMSGLGFTLALEESLARAQEIMQAGMAAIAGAGMTPAANMAGSYGGQITAAQAASVASYSTVNNSNSFGPVYVNTPMDLGEFEYRVRRIVGAMI